MFEITKEQIINRRKSLRVQTINEVIKITTNLKYEERLNFSKYSTSSQNILIHLIWHNYLQIS